jgi:hypothetical protein
MTKIVKQYYHDISINKNQLLSSRLHNLSSSERIILGTTLTIDDKGFQVYDTDYLTPYWWSGSVWLTSGVTGIGVQNRIAKWADTTNLTSSNITDNGTTVTIDSSITNIKGSTELLLSTNLLYVKSNKDLLLLIPTSQINPSFGLNQNFRIGFGADGTKIRNTVLGRFTLGDLNNININTGDWNTAIGYQVLGVNTSGAYNAALGAQSLRFNTTGNLNTGVGHQALYSNTSGSWNVGVGNQALYLNETGNYNVAIGFMAGFNDYPIIRGWRNTSNNVFIGYNCGNTGGTGSLGFNTFIGSGTGSGVETGAYNTIIGAQVSGLSGNTSNNIILADGQGNIRFRDNGVNTILSRLVGVGTRMVVVSAAGELSTQAINIGSITGSGTLNYVPKWTSASAIGNSLIYDDGTNIGIGTTTPSRKLDVNGDVIFNTVKIGLGGGQVLRNVSIGDTEIGQSSGNNTGDYLLAIGYRPLRSNTTGRANVAIGNEAMGLNTTGSYNSALSIQALLRNTTGNNNTAVGVFSNIWNTIGSNNISIGYASANSINGTFGLISGNYNIYLGIENYAGITTGNYNVIIGSRIQDLSANLSNNIVIADGQGNIRIRIKETGNVLIGTNTDTGAYKLDLNGNIRVRQVSEYASNAAAVSAGLIAGAFYRTGEFLKVVF